jgi:predicted O-linked N-acetylglucosamine transferase (SPINDLY family)
MYDDLAISEMLTTAWELHEAGRLNDAEHLYRQILLNNPEHADALHLLGVLAGQRGQYAQAVELIGKAISSNADKPLFQSNLAGAYFGLGNELVQQGRRDEAVQWQKRGRLDEAATCLERAVDLEPTFAAAHNNLGFVRKDRGQLAEAVDCLRRAVELQPSYAAAHSNLLNTLHFSPDYDSAAIYEESRRWQRQHAEPLAQTIRPHDNDPAAERRLRIGYISPDFREHCQAFFTVPLLAAHDRQNYEIYCYANVAKPDATTSRLQSYADHWRSITGRGNEEVAALIRQDRIDILVDLTMHMADNRLLVLARKPAPVQVCWLAYPGTTGLTAIDYRLTDVFLDPPGADESCYSEKSVRLPDCFWCYDPLTAEPLVNALPAVKNGHVTFGCLNNFCKINAAVLKLWAKVLRTLPGSRLMILAPEGDHRRHVLGVLQAEGVTAERIRFMAPRQRRQYLELYHEIDVGLDTLPYNGHTTSLDSYWMGVPVVTMVGQTVVGRAGFCQLSNLGLTELVAFKPDGFTKIATELAADLPRLTALRATLRQRLQSSPLMDRARFARNIEAAYRDVWCRWCADPARAK